eukprot:CAMPEP_0113539082 /NCGR_PEP_ID=MMETSP0015_2-20120614/7725_1 /TAXON_ID=2838 /ORGANISM="Odontella" /LENGTH=61 /DNA_ID=CAMNT_0000438731 /DNA_START=142 /DNA_END=327 /DNA_ORIENTATION=+ /assembly_acc=CAM_ASM_000160
MAKKQQKEEEFTLSKKGAKKVAKLEAQIPYYVGRGETDEVDKIKEKVASIRQKEMVAQGFD